MDISMQSQARINKYLGMGAGDLKAEIAMKIENPQIFRDFMASETIDWDYAVAAGILTRADIEYIKENVNSEEEEPTEEGGEGGVK